MAKKINREVRKVWRKVTGDSYVVWVTPVVGTAGAGSYLAKYMAKGMVQRQELEAAGFHRYLPMREHLTAVQDETGGTC